MSRTKRKQKLQGQFVPLFHQTLDSPAWRQLSFGARLLFIALRMNLRPHSNGHVYLSHRNAMEALGITDKDVVAGWYHELQHYGFLVLTEGACLGPDGKGKSAHWRITDMPTLDEKGNRVEATKDFLNWDGVVFEKQVKPSRRWSADKARKLAEAKQKNHQGVVT